MSFDQSSFSERYGWVCPKCQRVYAPSCMTCSACPGTPTWAPYPPASPNWGVGTNHSYTLTNKAE